MPSVVASVIEGEVEMASIVVPVACVVLSDEMIDAVEAIAEVMFAVTIITKVPVSV